MQKIKSRHIWIGFIVFAVALILATGLAVYHSGQMDDSENTGLVLVSAR